MNKKMLSFKDKATTNYIFGCNKKVSSAVSMLGDDNETCDEDKV